MTPRPGLGVGSFTRFYNASHTNVMGLVAVGRAMRSAGFSVGTHRMFSWWAMSDLITISRTLQALAALFDQISIHQLIFREE